MILGIAGGSGAGKMTVANTIAERLCKENVAYLSQDWYYIDQLFIFDPRRNGKDTH